MKKSATTALAALLLFGTASQLWAQDKVYRPEDTWFVRPKVGVASYLGDNEKSPLNFNGDAFDIGTPLSVVGEFGYQLSVPFSVGLALSYGDYPVITQFPPPNTRTDDVVADDPSSRTSVMLMGRYTFAESTTRTAPFLNFGLTGSFGTVRQMNAPSFNEEESGFGFGPVVGVGLDIAMNGRSSFFLELTSGLHFGDEALDANSGNGFGPGDWLTSLGAGLKINFNAAKTPVGVTSLTCPTENVMVGAEASFSAETNAAATPPVATSWSFGDGGSAEGNSASHTFVDDGTFTVTFTAENEVGPASMSCDVTVVAPAEINSASASKTSTSICDSDPSVSFSANVGGTAPITYSWDFGDGNTSSEAAPSHTYEALGSYTVTVTVTNVAGTDSESLTVEVTDEGCFDCNISSMNAVFFDRNSSVLNEEAMPLLAENLEVLQNCEFNVSVEGHSSRDERRPQQLSEDRARAVAQFYMDNGIDEGRLAVMGMGASGQTTKKAGAAQFRRVDTIPAQ